MVNDSPAVIIYDGYGDPIGTTTVLGEKALKVDVVKTAAPGTVGTGGTSSNFADAFPASGTGAGFDDGIGAMQSARVFDLDSGAGIENVLGTNLRTVANGGSVEAGTITHPLRTDPTGTTIQPVSGTVHSIIYDNLGNPVGTILDGVFYRLQVESKLTQGNSHIGSVSIDMGINTGVASTTGDAFGRLRTSLPQSLFEVTHQYDQAPQLMGLARQDAGTTLTHSSPVAILSVPAIAGRKIVHQSHQYMIYLPGKSHLIRMTGQLDSGTSIAGMGYGDDTDGIFLENSGGTMQIRFLSSTIAGQVITQPNWNIDTLDGYGPSGLILNSLAAYQLIIDFSWLGVGRIRVGLDIGGSIIYVHQFSFSNVVTTAYMRTGSLPIRWYLESTGAATSMKAICASVSSEGGSDPIGATYGVSRATLKTTLAVGVRTPLIALRPKATFNGLVNHVHLIWNNISFICTTADDLLVEVILGGTLTGASWVSADTNSHAEYDISTTAITGGQTLFQDYVSTTSRTVLSTAGQVNLKTLPLTLMADGTQNTATVCVTRIGNTSADCFAGFNWREVH